MIRNKRLLRAISVFFIVQFAFQTLLPTLSYALTSGPSQPEFSSFEPVATTNMVDAFTGDFTYNIPLIEVPGPHGSSYPLSLSYHSGATPEEEASWVGYGWTLNPGAINRGTRGIPDDHNGKDIVFHNKMPKNWTVSVGSSVGFGEVFGKDLKVVSASASLRYNNYRGFGYTAGLGVALGRGLVSMGYSVSDGEGSYSLNVNPYAILSWNLQNKDFIYKDLSRFIDIANNDPKFKDRYRKKLQNGARGNSINLMGSNYGLFSYTEASRPNIVHSFSGKSFNVSLGLEGNLAMVPVGGTTNLFGSYTYQQNKPTETVSAYGYLYSGEVTSSSDNLMDYHVERERDLNPRDVFLGVPFNDADNFIVTGEGVGGGFRFYNKTAGHFGPRKSNSHVDIFNVGGEVGTGWTFGPGADLGKGSTDLDVGDWSRRSNFEKTSSLEDEPVFLRFNNDLGGEWGFDHDDRPFQAAISDNLPAVPTHKTKFNQNERSARSSFISYHTNSEMMSGSLPSVLAYSRIKEVNELAKRSQAGRAELIGELTVFNEAGMQYNYGLPVYNQNEKSLSYSAKGLTPENNYIAFTGSPNTDVIVGEERAGEYASTYLLTEILTPDYLDRGIVNGAGEAGASPDDLGGYTRFNYKKAMAPGNDAWYTWRAPYRGLLYSKNSHSDPLDDLAGYSEGEKEIYYLHTLETKTHVALFVTENRDDSREAKSNEFTNDNGYGNFQLQRLVRIELYSIEDFQRNANNDLVRYSFSENQQLAGNPKLKANTKPIKTVHFEYDYTLTPGLPNQSSGGGKLTLKRVYFEYNGIARSRISPYEFKYQYPDYSQYPSKYRDGTENVAENVIENYSTLTAGDQNPGYSYFLSDAWGNYQKNGADRFLHNRPWLDQTSMGNVAGFDPAAWQLKVIKLPSGGEIHVQYEQDEYSYVQDQEAHVMANLKEQPDNSEQGILNSFTIDLASIGLEPNSSQIDVLNEMFQKRYVEGGKKVYFKILYRLIGEDPNLNPNYLSTCNAEYITGYASVVASSVDKANAKLTVLLANTGQNRLPREVCKDFVKSQRLGKVDPLANCDPSRGMSDPSNPKAIVNQLSAMIAGIAVPEALCKRVDINHSYFRIPTPLAKKGGGLRVKRLMMFDGGMGSGTNSVLYGNEYLYETEENGRIISSGVATNEPMSMREENILVDFVARKGQSLWSKIVAGKDKETAEGPLGESILPGPSVGYSRVVIKNIHSGKSTPGFTVTEFFTAKDYPVALAHPDIPETMTRLLKKEDIPRVVPTPFYSKIKNKTWATQGFSFVLNNMHGQLKSQSVHGGTYSQDASAVSASVISRTTYEYFKPGEKIPVMSSLFGEVSMKSPGREVDITFAQRGVTEKSNDVNVEVDLQITVIPLAFIVLVIPYPTAIPFFAYVDGELNTHATTKVVRYPAIVKKVEMMQDGIHHTQENLAFDEYTGKPVAVRTSDEFKGGYLAQSIPASWEYPDMAGKWKTQNKHFSGSFGVADGHIALASGNCALGDFTPGDRIQLGSSSSNVVYVVTQLDWVGNRLKVEPATGAQTASGTYTSLAIIKAGRTNQLQQQAGAITVHDELKENLAPLTIASETRYTANDFINDLNAARPAGGSGTFALNGTYTGMNMSAFAGHLTGCNVDLTNATVKDLEYRYSEANGMLKIELMAFDIDCGGNGNGPWIKIAGNGY